MGTIANYIERGTDCEITNRSDISYHASETHYVKNKKICTRVMSFEYRPPLYKFHGPGEIDASVLICRQEAREILRIYFPV